MTRKSSRVLKIAPIDRSETSELLTAEEAAAFLRLHIKSLYRLAKQGRIPSRKVGGQWRFHRQALDEWLKSTDKDTNHGN